MHELILKPIEGHSPYWGIFQATPQGEVELERDTNDYHLKNRVPYWIRERKPCGCCSGKQKQHLTITTVAEGKETNSEMDIDCVWCYGKGYVNSIELEKYNNTKNFWCKCGNPSEKTTYHKRRKNNPDFYTCNDCGKTTQIG